MAVQIDDARVRHIARLARLRLTDAEVRLFAGQLTQIIEYFQQIDGVDTAGVEPLAHPLPLTNVLRHDEPQPSFDADTALANAPQREQDFFRVPRVLDTGSA